MKSLISLTAMALCALLLSFAPQNASAQSIAVVNVQKIMSEASAAKSIKSKLEAQQKSFQTEVKRKETELQKKEQSLASQRAVLSADEFKKRVQGFGEDATKAQRDVQMKRLKLEKAFATALNQIQEKIANICERIAKEKSYEMIVPRSQLVYASATNDITDRVLSQLNRELPDVKLQQ